MLDRLTRSSRDCLLFDGSAFSADLRGKLLKSGCILFGVDIVDGSKLLAENRSPAFFLGERARPSSTSRPPCIQPPAAIAGPRQRGQRAERHPIWGLRARQDALIQIQRTAGITEGFTKFDGFTLNHVVILLVATWQSVLQAVFPVCQALLVNQ